MRQTCALAILLALFSLPARAQGPDDPASVPRIGLAEFKKLLADDAVIVLDVRPIETYRAGHIPGSSCLPLVTLDLHPEDVRDQIATLKAAKKPIVTYCA